MDFYSNLITILIVLPVVGALVALAFHKQESQLKLVALGVTLLNFVVSLAMFSKSTTAGPNGYLFEQNIPWIRAINTSYHVGIDGLSFWLVLLATFIMPISVISTWHAVEK